MKAYQVQFTLPVDNPVNNIRRTMKKSVVHFEVPINTPDIQNLGYSFLALNAIADQNEAEEHSKLIRKTPTLKNKKSVDSNPE